MALTKNERRQRIKYRIRKRLSGSESRPRMSVYRSNKQIYVQLVDDVTGKIIGAAIEVHKYLGPGLLENIYEIALCYEMNQVGLAVQRQVSTNIRYKDIIIRGQRIDVVVNEEVIVEIKSLVKLPDIATSQVLSYLHAMKLRRGLLINFGQHKLIGGIKRISL